MPYPNGLLTKQEAEERALESREKAAAAVERNSDTASLVGLAQVDATLAMVAAMRDGVEVHGDTSGRV